MKVLYQNFFLAILASALITSCDSCGGKAINEGFEKEFTETGCLIDTPSVNTTTKYNVNFFLETSGSMFGFMPAKNKTSFQTTLWDVVSLINSSPNGGLNMFQLKSKQESPIPVNISTFRDDLNSGLFQSSSQTDIPEMLDSVLAKTKKNQVSVIVSDLIFSPTSNSPALREEITTDIRNRFSGKSFASDIIQLYSEFYFRSKSGYEAKSPYYIWIIGDKSQVEDLSKMIKSRLTQFNEVTHGFKRHNISYSILPFAEANPTVSPLPCSTDFRYYLYGSWDGSEQAINIPLAVDLENLPPHYQQVKYLKGNVFVEEPNSAKVSLEGVITPAASSNATDKAVIVKVAATHLFKLKVSGIQNESNVIKINLKSQAPDWINTVNQEDEDNLRTKTNGFKRMISGLDQAYPSDPNLFNKPLLIMITKRTN